MTDNEIIKALMIFAGNGFSPCIVSLSELARQTLSLINRQQAECERLNNHIINLKCEKERQKADIERLNNECFCLSNERDAYKDIIDTAIAEAIKEFAERLKAEMENFAKVEDGNGGYYFLIGKSLIDSIAEKMDGDAE